MLILFFITLIFINHSTYGMDITNQEMQNTQLLKAAQDGDHKKCQLLLANNAHVNYTDEEGRTALEHATVRNYKEIVVTLIQAGANVNHKNEYDGTALCYVTLQGFLDMAKILLDAGANVNHVPKDQMTPLKIASMNGILPLVQLFLEYKADVHLGTRKSFSALGWATFNGNEPIVDLLLNAGAKTNYPDENDSPLRVASMQGYQSIVEKLIKAGTQIDATWNNGQTALTWAAINAKKDIARMLIQAGANPFRKDNNQKIPLTYAIGRKEHRHDICTFLVNEMVVYAHTKSILTFLLILKQLSIVYPVIYSRDIRRMLGQKLQAALTIENKAIARNEIERIEEGELKDQLLARIH